MAPTCNDDELTTEKHSLAMTLLLMDSTFRSVFVNANRKPIQPYKLRHSPPSARKFGGLSRPTTGTMTPITKLFSKQPLRTCGAKSLH